MAKQGVESVPIWSVITDLERNIAPLYRHAQQAPASEPVYQYWCYTTVENSEGDPEEFWFWKDCEKDFYDRWKNAKRTLYKTPQPAPVVPEDIPDSVYEILCQACGGKAWMYEEALWNACRAAMLTASPQSPGSEPATVPGKWIPVSERMPIEFEAVIAFDGDQVYGEAMYSSDDGFTIDGYEPCDRLNLQNVTHWMPLPAAPQEGK
ncbi:TPA: DUF551 domain-containing protein [Klebsiella pneumoniae]|nr:DUF551 domain-containing protein [Klebsiella pneumoniae]HCQ7561582.1 DUF551 domain-containing protein [Klebsiella pneumoniae]HCQ7917805.1 DUF551 domain-containing protein [Klebsiella pneumoniae]